MPQLDPEFFVPQLVWLAISFIALYVLMSRMVLPRVDKVLLARAERIGGNLEKAEKLKSEAEEALRAYQQLMADARSQAQASLAQATAEIVRLTTEREAAFAEKTAAQMKAAENNISAAKSRALSDIRGTSTELATAIVGKLTGVSISSQDAASAVDEVVKGRA